MAKVKVYVCNFDDLNINSLSKLNWLPYCIDNVQWYVAEVSTFNSQTLQESTPIKIYKGIPVKKRELFGFSSITSTIV